MMEAAMNRHAIKELQSQIDALIHNLSDSNVLKRKKPELPTEKSSNLNRHKRRRRNNAHSTGTSSSIDTTCGISYSIKKESSPIGLERQYNELYTLLRRGLLGRNNDENDDDDDDKNTTSCSIDNRMYAEEEKKNVSALLLGPRGQGKSLVLERVLTCLTKEWKKQQQNLNQHQKKQANNSNNDDTEMKMKMEAVPFRLIRLDGILLRGHDVNIAVKEIVRQLSEIASRESFERLCSNATRINPQRTTNQNQHENSVNNERTTGRNINMNATTTITTTKSGGEIHEQLYKILEKESYNLRTRNTTFNNSLATLDEALKTACIDSIPILIIMDELDSFLNHSTSVTSNSYANNSKMNTTTSSVDVTSKRHLLLYHLLDRVAGKGSLISMVSSTSRLSTIGMFEKRVRSRAEGTTKIIYFGRPATYDKLVDVLLSKIDEYNNINIKVESSYEDADCDDNEDESIRKSLKKQLSAILLPSLEQLNDENSDNDRYIDSDERQKLNDDLFMVQDILKRNFSFGQDIRWFCRVVALSLSLYMEDLNEMIELHVSGDDSSDHDDNSISIPVISKEYFMDALTSMGGLDVNIKAINVSSSDCDNNPNVTKKTTMLDTGNPRMKRLRDLTGPQIAVLLSAKRIIYRDSQNEMSNIPLTFERMLNEYESYFVAQSRSSGPDHYSQNILFRSFRDLLGVFLMPARDHSGGGPGQYSFGRHYSNVENPILRRIALHVNVDIEGELVEALKRNLLDCTSALRDWGLGGCKSTN